MNWNTKSFLLAAMLGTSIAYLAYIAPSIYGERKSGNSQPVKMAEQSDLEKKIDLPGIEPEAVSLKSFPGFKHADQYDELVLKYTKFWNGEFKQFEHFDNYTALNPNLVKAMICRESGSPEHRDGPFRFDPMQVANKGDLAFPALFHGSESGLEAYGATDPILRLKKQTPRRNGRWDYSLLNEDERMDAETSIKYGIRWLFHKAFSFNADGKRGGFKGWDKALEGYNGKAQYADEVKEILESR